MKIQLPPNIVARGGWKFDITALVDAHTLLGLEKEVRFRFTAGGTKAANGDSRSGISTLGAHRIKIDMDTMQFYHGITISQDLTIDAANMFLWHELRHAWQSEAYAKATGKSVKSFYEAYKAQGISGGAYDNNKWEIDANNYAKNRCSEGKWLVTAKK